MDPKRSQPPGLQLAEMAAAQHGVVALGQLLALGWTTDRVKGAVRRGVLLPVHRGVYALGHRAHGTRTAWMAAVLAIGPGALLSHTSAAVLWNLLRAAGDTIHLTSPNKRRSRPGLTIHRTTNLSAADRTTREQIPTTTLPRTLIDLADVLTPRELARAIERVPFLDAPTMHRALERHPGRRATTPLRHVLALYEAPTRSHLERTFLKLCATHDIERPDVNAHIAGHERDFSWPHARLVVEVDGHAFHHTRAQRATDARRDLELNLAGWRVQRFTYEQVVFDPAGTASAVRRLTLGQSSAAGSTSQSSAR